MTSGAPVALSLTLPQSIDRCRLSSLDPLKNNRRVVRGHLDQVREPEPVRLRKLPQVGGVAHAPFGVVAAEVGIECFVARRIVGAIAAERAVEKQPADTLKDFIAPRVEARLPAPSDQCV